MLEPQGKLNNENIGPENVNLEDRFDAGMLQDPHTTEKEVVRETISEVPRAQDDTVYAKILSQVATTQQTNAAAVAQDASMLHQMTDLESQISHLMDIATTKGVVHAVKVAQHTEDFYVLDQLHDRMRAEEFYQALLAKGLIEE